jgi:hypothetical protein
VNEPSENDVDLDDTDPSFALGRGARGPRALVLRPVAERRARSHPWAVVGLWAWQTAVAMGASVPAAAFVGGVYGAGPRGDAPLWDPGGHALLDFLWHGAHAVHAWTAAAEIALVLGAVGGLLPTAAAMIAIAWTQRDRATAGLAQSLSAALPALPALVFAFFVLTAAQALTVGIGAGASGAIEGWTHAALGEARAQRLGLAVAFAFVLVASGLGVVHDLARAAVVCARARGPRAIVIGARAFGGAPLLLWWSWAWRWLGSLAPVLAVAALTGQVGGRGGAALVFIATLHQAVVLTRVGLRASWLACAMRSVGS